MPQAEDAKVPDPRAVSWAHGSGKRACPVGLRWGKGSKSSPDQRVQKALEFVGDLFHHVKEGKDQLAGTISGRKRNMLAIAHDRTRRTRARITVDVVRGIHEKET